MVLKQTVTRPEASSFEKLTQYALKSSDNYRFFEDFRRKKINYFAQIESIMEVHFGDNLLQVLFLTLFTLKSAGVHFSNNLRIIGFVVVVIIINTFLFHLFLNKNIISYITKKSKPFKPE